MKEMDGPKDEMGYTVKQLYRNKRRIYCRGNRRMIQRKVEINQSNDLKEKGRMSQGLIKEKYTWRS